MLLVTLMAAAAIAATAQGGKPLPVFEIDKTEHNFGDVFLGEDLIQVFSVRNQGAAPLELSDNPILLTGSPKVSRYQVPDGPAADDRQPRLVPVGLTKRASAPT